MEIDVKTGKYKELTKKPALRLAVTRDGIYYSWFSKQDAKEQKDEDGVYSFQDKKIHKIENRNDNAILQDRFGRYAIVTRLKDKNKELEYYVTDLETNEERGIIETETISGESVSQEYRLGEKWFFHSYGKADVESDVRGTETGTWWSVDIIDPKEVITSKDGSTYSKPVDVTDLRTDGRYLYTRGDGLKVLEVREDGVYVIWSQSQKK